MFPGMFGDEHRIGIDVLWLMQLPFEAVHALDEVVVDPQNTSVSDGLCISAVQVPDCHRNDNDGCDRAMHSVTRSACGSTTCTERRDDHPLIAWP